MDALDAEGRFALVPADPDDSGGAVRPELAFALIERGGRRCLK